jgi:hypothetical protein
VGRYKPEREWREETGKENIKGWQEREEERR